MTESTTINRSGLGFWAPMIAAGLALFIVVVDSTMMNVAVPTSLSANFVRLRTWLPGVQRLHKVLFCVIMKTILHFKEKNHVA